jgi:hypothetical protein
MFSKYRTSKRSATYHETKQTECKTGFCKKCGTKGEDGFPASTLLCCLMGEPKDPPECLWCGESLDDKNRAFCSILCSRDYHRDVYPGVF